LAAPIFHARRLVGINATRNYRCLLAAQKMVRIMELETPDEEVAPGRE